MSQAYNLCSLRKVGSESSYKFKSIRSLTKTTGAVSDYQLQQRFEMGPGISQSPTGSPTGRESQAFSPQSPQSTEEDSRIHSPWLDPLSPNLRDSFVIRGKHDSEMGLLGTNRADHTGPGLDVFRSSSNKVRQPDPWSKKVVKSKWSMVICLMLGVGSAFGHHFLYDHLHGREAKDQQWWFRLGQFISFIAKANFVVAVLMARQQVAWRAVGQKGFSVEAVDSLFGAVHDVMELFNKEAWNKSWLVMCLAMYMWVSTFIVIFSSATLDVVPDTKRENTTCPSIRTLNFSNDVKKSWRDEKKAENETLIGISLSFYNETMDGKKSENKNDHNFFDYWDMPSKALGAIASTVFPRGQPLQRDNVALEVCGDGWDCLTTIHFMGPGYKCKQLAKNAGSTMEKFGDAKPPVDLDMLVPAGNYTYYATTNEGDYSRPQINPGEGGVPTQPLPFPPNLGAFRTEPIIWLGHATVDDVTTPHAQNNSDKGWKDDYTPVIFACEHWETNYTVNLNYTSGLQTYNVTKRDYKHKIIDTTYIGNSSSDGTLDGTIAAPKENYVQPHPDFRKYRQVAAYHALGKKLRDLLHGSIKLPDFITDSEITTSKLIDRHEHLTVPNFQDAVRHLYEDLLISLLSDPQLLVVSWAADPSKLSGTGVGGPDTYYSCIRQREANYFFYNWKVLVAVYVASFAVASVGVTYGIVAMYKDGVREQREMTFSSIAGATRRVSLDQNEDRETKIRCWPVEERSGDRLYEFRAEGRAGQENGSRSAFGEKASLAVREVAEPWSV
ncbi:hypothetical protein DER46DRAFT_688820 [Fusarium sp. MPI-SDFR-AT-0072]|nr:hypothetical protein DER46DRAFT_688820 [Fusarium sp. MPI-SDFR-AT-0072]